MELVITPLETLPGNYLLVWNVLFYNVLKQHKWSNKILFKRNECIQLFRGSGVLLVLLWLQCYCAMFLSVCAMFRFNAVLAIFHRLFTVDTSEAPEYTKVSDQDGWALTTLHLRMYWVMWEEVGAFHWMGWESGCLPASVMITCTGLWPPGERGRDSRMDFSSVKLV